MIINAPPNEQQEPLKLGKTDIKIVSEFKYLESLMSSSTNDLQCRVITSQQMKSLDSFATKCYRVMLNIRRSQKKANGKVYKRVGNKNNYHRKLSSKGN